MMMNHDRRRFLHSSGKLLACGAMAHGLGPSMHTAQAAERREETGPNLDAGLIDAHVHVWTSDQAKYPLAAGYRPESMNPATFPPELLFSHARPAGVSRIVLIQMSFYGFDNRYMLDTIEAYPGVFAGVAVIDVHQRHIAETMKKLKRRHVAGFRLRPPQSDAATMDAWLQSPGIQTMFRVGASTGQAMCFLMNPNAVPFVDRMCGQFPDTTVVIDHMARIGIDGKIAQSDVDHLLRCARHPNTFVKVSAFYALGKKRPPYTDLGNLVRQLRDGFGSERLMWASDCPFQVDPGHSYNASIELIRSELDFLSASDRRRMLRDTAQDVFFS